MKQNNVKIANIVWFVAVGLFSLFFAIINTIIMKPPIAAWIAITLSESTLNIDEKIMEDMQSYSLLVELIVMIKAIHFIFWFYYSSTFLKSRKVNSMYKLMKSFIILLGVYTAMTAFEIWITIEFLNHLADNGDV